MRKLINKIKSYFEQNEDKDEKICKCFNISNNDIVKEVNQGCESIRDVRLKTKAGTGCGRCNASVERVTYKSIKMRDKK